MKKLVIPVAALLLLGARAFPGAHAAPQEPEPKAAAEKWIAQADSVRTLVDGVLTSAVEAGAADHPVAKDNVVDARHWMAEGEKTLKSAEEKLAAEEYESASQLGNMAWQYFVKAGTAAVLAARLASGGAR